MLQTIVYHTLGQLATGILLLILLVPPSRIGAGFGRFHTMLALALWICALWGKFPPAFILLAALLLAACFSSSKDRYYYPLLVLSVATSFYLVMLPGLSRGWLESLWIHLPPVLVLGASAVAMLLGHWYLVAPKLSIRYLKVMTIALIAALLIRAGVLAEIMFWNSEHLTNIRFYEIYGIFFLQRVALGLFLTFVLSILTYFCVRIPNTQSATGILYVVVVFCLIGELIGSYLFVKTGFFL